ncbi:MAG: ABC transporter permease [Lacunisphaera sp.]
MSVPGFLLALVLMYFSHRYFGLNPSGLFSPEFATTPGWSWAKFADLLKHLWLPTVVLGLGGTAGMIRVMRANLLDELRKPYVTTARAKGVSELRLLLKYPVAARAEPVHLRHRRHVSRADLRRRHRRDRDEPADDRPRHADGPALRGRLPRRLHAHGHDPARHPRHAGERPPAAVARTRASVSRAAAVERRAFPFPILQPYG